MKVEEIQRLIKFVSKSGVSEVAIEDKDFKITIKTQSCKKDKQQQVIEVPQIVQAPQQAPIQQQAATASVPSTEIPPKEAEKVEDSNYITIKSPMIGTFYRKPSPDKPAFVNVGDDIKNDTVVCMVEAMKLFNEIEAELSGKIVKVLVDDGDPVEYDQPLFLVDPS